MNFETINKSHKKQIIVGVSVFVVLVSVIAFTTTRAKYKSEQNVKIASGSVSYKQPDLKLVSIQVSEDGANYTNSTTIPTGNYKLNEEKSACRIPTSTQVGEDAPKDNNISIEFTDGKLNILGLTTKNAKCYVYLDKHEPTSEDTLAKLNITNVNSGTPTFTNVATTDEGIYSAADGMYGGTSYYWRGAATTNHVIFADKCWRIVRINGDGTIRLIYNGSVLSGNKCFGNGSNADSIAKTGIAYNTSYNNSSYVGWTYTLNQQRPEDNTNVTDSNAKEETESWFNINITGTNATKVVDGKFCNDRDTKNNETWRATGSTFYYAAYERLWRNYDPTLDCNDKDVYNLKVGAITADEVQFAGASWNTNNTSYYLYNEQYYWTMSSSGWWNDTDVRVFYVNSTGYLSYDNVSKTYSLRPVINLKADVELAGFGTKDNPYVVS